MNTVKIDGFQIDLESVRKFEITCSESEFGESNLAGTCPQLMIISL